MKYARWVLAGVAMLAVGTALSQMGGGKGWPYGMGHAVGEEEGVSVQRHQRFMREGIPAEYAALRNPLKAGPAPVAAGKALFAEHCVVCHGPAGKGDGPQAASLKPRPANLTLILQMPIASDGYLVWTISEGGVPVGSAMPVFKTLLKPEQVWQLVSYLRSL